MELGGLSPIKQGVLIQTPTMRGQKQQIASTFPRNSAIIQGKSIIPTQIKSIFCKYPFIQNNLPYVNILFETKLHR